MSLHQHRQHGDKHAINRHHVTVLTSHQPNPSFRAPFGRPAGHGPVHTDANNAFFIPRAKAGHYNKYSLLQLSGVGRGGLEEKDFQTFRNEAVKLLSNTQSRAEECGRQPQQQTLHNQQPTAREYILTIPETQIPTSKVIQPTQKSYVATKGQQQQQTRGQSTSFLVIDNQQAGPLRPLKYTLTLIKHFNLPSVASTTGEESQHNATFKILQKSSVCD